MLSDEQIKAIWPVPEGPNTMLMCARAIEAAVLSQLREGGVELPEPESLYEFRSHGKNRKPFPYFTEAQLLDYGDRRAVDVVEDFKADLADALCEDCENGVKWLNEQAIEKFKRDFPNVYKVMQSTIPKEQP